MEYSKGIITSIKFAHNPLNNEYTVLTDRVLQLSSNLQLNLYNSVEVNEGKINILPNNADDKDYTNTISKLVGIMSNNTNGIVDASAYSEITEKMIPELKKAASLLVKGFLSGSPVQILCSLRA